MPHTPVVITSARALRGAAATACVVVAAMLAVFVTTGIGQDPLQYVHPVDEYGRLLLRSPAVLRTVIGLDNVFVVLYCATFLLLATVLKGRVALQGLLTLGVGLMVAVGLLDLVENLHFLTMIGGAGQGRIPGRLEIEVTAVESLLKFHLSYLALFLIGLSLPRDTLGRTLLARASVYVQLPLGVAVYVVPAAAALPLVLLRFGYFVAALATVAVTFGAATGGSTVPGGTDPLD